MGEPRLSIELVPQTSWYSNVRSNVSKGEWDKIRRRCYRLADNKCEICGESAMSQGKNYHLEAHEIWEYDDVKRVQKLVGIIGLCNFCHTVKHPGLASIHGRSDLVLRQLMKVNSMSKQEAQQYLDKCFEVWKGRSKYNWTLDISFLTKYYD